MNELDEIRKRKIQEIQQQQEEEIQLQAQIQQMELIVKQFLDKDALERFGNIKAAYPEKATQLTVLLSQLIQSGQIQNPLNDSQFKAMLERLNPDKREIKITRK